MSKRERYDNALKVLLKTGWQRQDSTLQQLMDVEPVVRAAGISLVSDYIASLDKHDLVDTGIYRDQAKDMQALPLPGELTQAGQRKIAIHIANLLGCYDAADAIGNIPIKH